MKKTTATISSARFSNQSRKSPLVITRLRNGALCSAAATASISTPGAGRAPPARFRSNRAATAESSQSILREPPKTLSERGRENTRVQAVSGSTPLLFPCAVLSRRLRQPARISRSPCPGGAPVVVEDVGPQLRRVLLLRRRERPAHPEARLPLTLEASAGARGRTATIPPPPHRERVARLSSDGEKALSMSGEQRRGLTGGEGEYSSSGSHGCTDARVQGCSRLRAPSATEAQPSAAPGASLGAGPRAAADPLWRTDEPLPPLPPPVPVSFQQADRCCLFRHRRRRCCSRRRRCRVRLAFPRRPSQGH